MANIASVPGGTGGRGVLPRLPWNTWLFGSLAVLLGVWSTWTALSQPPRPDPFRPATAAEALLYPFQRNAFARNPVIRGDLRTVFAIPGTRTVWAGGDGGLLVRSDDGGVHWTRVSLAGAFANPSLTAPDSATTAFRAAERGLVAASIIPPLRLFQQGGPPQQQDSTRPNFSGMGLYRDANGGLWCGAPLNEGQLACTAELAQEGGAISSGTPPSNLTPVPITSSTRPPEQAQGVVPDPAVVTGADSIDPVSDPTVTGSDTLDTVTSIFFTDAKRGWLTTFGGSVLQTRDGGERWERVPPPGGGALFGDNGEGLTYVHFTHRDTGWVAGDFTVLRYTREGGWWVAASPTDTLDEGLLLELHPLDGTSAYAATQSADGPGFWVTRDGGNTWNPIPPPPVSDSSASAILGFVRFPEARDRGFLVDDGTDSAHLFVAGPDGVWIETGPRTPKSAAIRFANKQTGAMVGVDGRLRYTVDGGGTWLSSEPGTFRHVNGLALDAKGRGYAVGSNGLVLATEDGGRRWTVRSGGGGELRAGGFAGAGGWIVGGRGTLLASRDSGRTWRPRTSGTDEDLRALYLSPDGLRGWAVGSRGTAIQMRDGRTWTPAVLAPGLGAGLVEARESELVSVHFVDADHGWIAGDLGVLLATANGGATWDTLPRHPMYYAGVVQFRSLQRGWLGGDDGVYRTEDGGRTWIAPDSSPVERILALHFLNDSVGWAAGVDGVILATRDGGRSWTAQPSRTRSTLTGIRFVDPRNGWAAGWDGTLLTTTDGGASWLSETSGVGTDLHGVAQTWEGEPWVFGDGGLLLRRTADGEWLRAAPPGRPWPGAWYLGTLLLTAVLGLMAVPARRPPAEPDPVDGVLLSDRPLGPGDPDPLDLGRVARGISRFLRNEGTEPPLTIAITGGWGSGKSSLMNLVRGDLARRGWRPVWFNAWHHQTEEHLLAALLENVRSQAVPSWLSVRGLVFRARLLGIRIRRSAAGVGAAVAAAVLYTGYLTADPARIGRVRDALTATPEAPGGALALLERIATVLFPGDLAAAVLVYGVIGGCVALGRALRAFGVNPARLLATASRAVRLRELEEKPGFRHRFAVNFQEVTRALRPRDLVIFIDDLDRCRPKNVMTILEAVNFLVSSGECVVIMGMDAPRVIHSVAMELKSEAGEEDPHDFARRYLEKLINIDVPVPTPEQTRLHLLLLPTPLPPARSRTATLVRGAGRGARATAPMLTAAAVLATVFLLGRWLSPPLPVAEPRRGLAPAAAAFVQPAPGFGDGGSARGSDALPVAVAATGERRMPSRSGAVFTLAEPASNDWLLAVGLALTLLLVAWQMANRPEATTRDSDAFSRGRTAWMRYVASMQPTPRRSKKFMNRLRFYVMRQGSAAGPETLRERLIDWLFRRPRIGGALMAHGFTRPEYASGPERSIPEAVLVGLISLQEFQPDVLRDSRFYRQFRARMAMHSGNREEVLEALEYPAALSDEDRALFAALVEGVRIS